MRARQGDVRVPRIRRGGRRSQARRPGAPVRTRIASRLPSRARAAAACLCLALVSVLGYLVAGPVARVERIEWDGNHFTADAALERRLSRLDGTSVLLVDTEALARELAALPGVAGASVRATLPDRVQVTIREDQPALVWRTERARLLVTAEGAVIGELPLDGELGEGLAALPVIDDRRSEPVEWRVGGSLPAVEVRTATRLTAVDPAVLGSVVPALSVQVDELYGFTLVAPEPGWTAALGFYGREPGDDAEASAERLERQIAALRTVFASRPEATVTWLDARNPGKVYFRASEG